MRRILCLCHDVTDQDIARAVAAGYTHPEIVKRYTGALMGPCQGRGCRELVLDALAAAAGLARGDMAAPTSRPPAFAIRMGDLAGGPAVTADDVRRGLDRASGDVEHT
jgi:bacterioferritin-associated ferredoxin